MWASVAEGDHALPASGQVRGRGCQHSAGQHETRRGSRCCSRPGNERRAHGQDAQGNERQERQAAREMSTNIMHCHDRFLSAAAYHVSRHHTASFPAGKAWGAGLVMAWIQKHTAVAAREREIVMVALAVLLEVVEQVEPETPVLGEVVVVGWSVAPVVLEVRPQRAAEARFAVWVAPVQAGREAESGNMVRQTKWAVLQDREVTAEDTLPIPWTTTLEWAVGAVV
jgi:hypothetical protein